MSPNHFKTSINFISLNKEQINQDINREWLVTNGLGSYASGTLSSILTRRYHGLFVIAKKPPLGRVLYVSKIEEEIEYSGNKFLLSSNKWEGSEELFPKGYQHIESFYLDDDVPTWHYKCNELLLEKKYFFEFEKNTFYITYKILNDFIDKNVLITSKLFVNNRDFHALNKDINIISRYENGHIHFLDQKNELLFSAYSDFENILESDILYFNYQLDAEKERGFDFIENHKCATIFTTNLSQEKKEAHIILSTEDSFNNNPNYILTKIKEKNKKNLFKFSQNNFTPQWISQILYSAEHFIVKRENQNDSDSKSILAGYHWFGDWGRDTMISLPGLCCATGQYSIAKSILENYAKYLDQGMIPNRFSDYGETPEYNTVDATLWYIEAIANYFKYTNDIKFLKYIYPVLKEIIDSYFKGTRFNIKCDIKDGLIYAGEKGLQLTWMDAKANNVVFTERIGKPIEVNALWYNALKNMIEYSKILNIKNEFYFELSEKIELNFIKYWDDNLQYCYDVIDSPEGNDNSLRPNQIIALSLPFCPLNSFQKKSIIDICGKKLLTLYGLRSLAKDSANYKGKYIGDHFTRDASYHQGTSWSWLLGVYAIAYFNVTHNASVALGFVEPLAKHLNESGVGFISEIFDGDSPYQARGCIAQAWGVAETLRAWKIISPHVDSLKQDNYLIKNMI
ncbi:amylo-alpha-1,6-glucosidase [Fluviispira multicolorata]|uniref:Glycogen debranching protein n=1 Tax=Fluviispira multicolorata TaxID=2654512 RepID=A0A833JHM0_9BACT|nr:amylo-alpha-1,6-glucosidase [Fluviispira multicolorata]KAB8033537.1 glycogen debranching protein [Fluviispira multicolorata]